MTIIMTIRGTTLVECKPPLTIVSTNYMLD